MAVEPQIAPSSSLPLHDPSAASASTMHSPPHWDQHSVNDYSSYAGSFGSNSEWGQNDTDGAALAGPFGPDDAYNPTDFDASPPAHQLNNPGSLNFFDHENLQPDVLADLDLQPAHGQFISLSFTPAEPFHKHHDPPSPFVNPSDLSSPGSSPGSVHNSGHHDGRHSRSSSVGSHHSPIPIFNQLPDHRQPQLATTAPSRSASPPQIKAASPPALVIPADSAPAAANQSRSHLLPGGPAGIDINIVPSTPISPGTAANAVSFQQVMHTMNDGDRQQHQQQQAVAVARVPSPSASPRPTQQSLAGAPMDIASPQMWNVSPHGSPAMPSFRTGLHYRGSSEESVRIPANHSLQNSPNLPPAPFPRGADLANGLVNLSLGLNGGAPFASPQPQPNSNDMLLAAQLRHRSRSDTSMHPPNWGPHAPQGGQTQMFPPPPNFGLGGLGLSGMPPSGMNGFPGTVDPTDVLGRGAQNAGFPPMGFDMNQGQINAGGMLPPFRLPQHQSYDDSDNLLLPGIRRSRSDGQSHRRGVRSEDFSMYSAPGEPNDILRSITTPDGSLAPSDPRVSPNMRRRGSSRGHERGSSLSSGRPSPYPSPNASPRHPEEMLPVGGMAMVDLAVSRPHVTTPATAVASNSRRKSEANFVCPIPGCGSTFTRHFNLKGHLRSHNEERPFRCKWPGCEKGFARQHDCKRHEALHLNIRPYTCEGCGKTFARMDALNRHLRSEGGVECRKLGDESSLADVNMSTGFDPLNTGGLQPMPLGARGDEWTSNGGLVL